MKRKNPEKLTWKDKLRPQFSTVIIFPSRTEYSRITQIFLTLFDPAESDEALFGNCRELLISEVLLLIDLLTFFSNS